MQLPPCSIWKSLLDLIWVSFVYAAKRSVKYSTWVSSPTDAEAKLWKFGGAPANEASPGVVALAASGVSLTSEMTGLADC
jgi:hypothetical protein